MQRRYRNKPTASRLVHFSTRVRIRGTKRTAVDAVKPRKVHQGSGGKTYASVPTSKPCCKRNCFSCVTDPSHPSVVAARKPLFDITLTRPELRSALTDNHLQYLLHTDGRPVCVEMACRIYGISLTKLYPDKRQRRSRSESRAAKNQKAVCLLLV